MFAFFGKQIKPYRKIIFCVLFLQVGQTLLSLYLPRINAGIIDYGVVNGDTGYIIQKGIIMVALSVLQFFCAVGASILGAKAALSVGRDLREKIYTKILSYSQREIADFGAPTLITRATNDVEQVVRFLTILLTVLITAPVMFVVGIIMAIAQSVSLSVVILVTVPMLAVIAVIFLLKMLPYYKAQQERIDGLNGVLRDQIAGVRVAKAFTREPFEMKRFGVINKDLSEINLAITRLNSLMSPLFTFIVNAATIAILWFGGYLSEHGSVQVGEIIAFITYLSFIMTATLSAAMVFILMPRAAVATDRIIEVLDAKVSVEDAQNPTMAKSPCGEVRFEDVSYSYAPEHPEVEPVLQHLTFTAKPGTTTAIIGSTGSGKTTLLNLIPRLTDATGGTVYFDGVDVKKLKQSELRSAIGMVPQKAFLFAGSLAENMRQARSGATDEEIWEALRVAQAEEFIKENKDGIQMRVSEGGSNFSGGQRQRLAIARAIVRRPKVYLFDDSFSALDYATDKKLRGELKHVTADAAVIVVAQRISSVIDADNIIVLNNGRIEDMGTHSELIARCATYQEIAATQPTEETGVSA